MSLATFKMLKGQLDQNYGEYPFKGCKTQTLKFSNRLRQKPSLNPRVIWRHLRYNDL